MKNRRKKANSIDFSFDSLADIISNVLGIMVLLSVMIGVTNKSTEEEKKEKEVQERETVIGKMDAMSDLIFKDNRLALPLEREARYNRFHVHFIVKDNTLYFIDLSEFNYEVQKEKKLRLLDRKTVGDCIVRFDAMDLMSDTAQFIPIRNQGFKIDKSTDYATLRQAFRLEKKTDGVSERFLTQLAPNNHAVHFHVFPSGIEAFNLSNDYIRMLGFDTGYELLPENDDGRIQLPTNLRDGTKYMKKFQIQ